MPADPSNHAFVAILNAITSPNFCKRDAIMHSCWVALFIALMTVMATPSAQISAPGNFAVTGSTTTSITLEWDRDGTLDHSYRLNRKEGGSLEEIIIGFSTNRGHTDSGLNPDTEYTYQVRRLDPGRNPGLLSDAITVRTKVDPAAPGTPTVILNDTSSNNISLGLTAPTNTGANPLVSYEIARAPIGESFITSTIPHTLSTRDFAGLEPNTEYEFRVRAINQNAMTMDRAKSKPIVLTAFTLPERPDVPVDLRVTGSTTTSIELSWTAPADNGGTLERYEITRTGGLTGTGTSTVTHTAGTTTFTENFTGLAPGTEYEFQVRAINTNGAGDTVMSFASRITVATLPNAPENLRVTGSTTNSIMLSWMPPTNNGDSAITGYEIFRVGGTGPVDTSVTPLATGTATTHLDDNGLAPGMTYSYAVTTTNIAGSSESSIPVTTSTIAATPPDAPGTPTVVGSVGTSSVTFSWSPPADNGSMINSYKIQRAEGGGGFADLPPPTPVFTGADRGYNDIGLAPNTQYSYQLRAINAIGTGSPSTALVVTTLPAAPDAPVDLRVTGSTATSIDLEWNAVVPAAVGGNMIVGYRIERQEVGGGTVVENTGLVTTYTDPDPANPTATPLSLGTTYQYRVRAIDRNAAGGESLSAFSGTATVTTAAVAPPAAPGTPTVTGSTATSVTFEWNVPTDNGSTISDYQIERAQGAAGFSLLSTIGSPTTTHTDPEPGTAATLDPNIEYRYRVRAINGEGDGVFSPALSVTTLPAAPAAPGTPTVTNTGTSSVTLEWNAVVPAAVGGNMIVDYQIQRQAMGGGIVVPGGGTVVENTGLFTTYTDMNGLLPSTTYLYRVRAIDRNAGGDSFSAFSGTATVTTAAVAPPGTPTAPDAPGTPTVVGSVGTSSVTFGWNVPADNGSNVFVYVVERAVGAPGLPGSTGFGAIIELDRIGMPDRSEYTDPPVGASGAFAPPPLNANTIYRYRVRARNSEGDGPPSNALSVTTLPTPPAAPGTPTVTASTATRITLEWTAPTVDNGGNLESYDITQTEGTSIVTRSVPHSNGVTVGGTTTFTENFTGLDPNTPYEYNVVAINRGDAIDPATGMGFTARSLPSATVMAMTMPAPTPGTPTVPDAPGTPTVTGSTATSITFSWNAPADNGSAITHYQIERRQDGLAGATFMPITTPNRLPVGDPALTGTSTIRYTDTNGLASGTQYSYRVIAINAIDPGAASGIVTTTTVAVAVVVAPSGLELTAMLISATEVELSWTLEATGGAAVTYELERSEDPSFTATTAVTLTPNTVTSVIDSGLTAGTQYYYQVTATNSAGSETSDIERPTGGLSERAQALNESLLPIVVQATAAINLSAISNRIDNVSSGAGNVNTFAGADSSHAIIKQLGSDLSSEQELGDMLLKWLGNSSFSHSLAGSGIAGGAGLSVWGSGDYKDLDNDDNALRWDGNVWGLSVGADVQLNADWLLGTAVSWSSGEFDYTDRATESIGDYDYENFGIHPYFNWAPSGAGYNIWGSASYGSGEIEIRDQAMPGAVSSDTSQYGVAAGINLTLSSSHSQQASHSIDLKSDVSALWVDIDGSGEDILSDTVEHQRARLLLSSEHDYLIGAQRHLIPSIELGGRYDTGGGAEDGTAIELAASLSYKDLLAGFHLSGRMNTLLGADYEEWGASALMRFGGGASSRGLSFSLEPTIGRASSDPSRLWQQGLSDLSNSSSSLSGSLVSEISYGMGMHSAFSVPATWQPYANMELGSAIRRYRLGLRYQFVQGLGFRIEGQSLRNSGASTTDSNTGKDYGVQLKTEFEF